MLDYQLGVRAEYWIASGHFDVRKLSTLDEVWHIGLWSTFESANNEMCWAISFNVGNLVLKLHVR